MSEIEQKHISDVENIQKQIRVFYSQKKKVKIYHGSTNSTRLQNFKKGEFIDISILNKTIEINGGEKYILVEPNVPMDQLVKETLKFGLIPPVVMEFPGITVGGGIQGGAGESSSFKYGLFHDCCLEYEIVLGNGDIIKASSTENSDLFFGTAGSYGSLGIITLVKLKLEPAQKFVHISYTRVANFEGALEVIDNKRKNGETNFIDGMMFSKSSGVIISGVYSGHKNLPIHTFHKATDEWFCLHVEKRLKGNKLWEELIPLEDYLFRYDRGAFWMGKYAFNFLNLPFNKLTRFIFAIFCTTRRLYLSMQAVNFTQEYFIQDMSVPKENTLPFFEYLDKNINIYPLWICPIKPVNNSKLSPNNLNTDLIINIGAWGKIKNNPQNFVQINKEVERKIEELKGRKILYAHQYYFQEEFWQIYDRAWYQSLRKKYFAENTFRDIYEKTVVTEEYKASISKGFWRLLKSPFKIPIN